MRVLVTGATGFLGNAVTAALVRHGHEPVTFVRHRPPGVLAHQPGRHAQPARRSGRQRRSAWAAVTGVASTISVYGTPTRQPITEDAPTLPQNPYGASKLAADQAAASVAATGALGAVSLRAGNIAGAAIGVTDTDTDTTRLIPKILAVHAGLEPELVINGDGPAVRDFVHVLDMAEAFVLDARRRSAPIRMQLTSGRKRWVE